MHFCLPVQVSPSGIVQREARSNLQCSLPSRRIHQASSTRVPEASSTIHCSLPYRRVPQASSRQEAIPSKRVPQASSRQEAIPSKRVPQASFRQEAIPSKRVPQASFRQEAIPSKRVPQASFRQEAISSKRAPQALSRQEAIPSRRVPQASFKRPQESSREEASSTLHFSLPSRNSEIFFYESPNDWKSRRRDTKLSYAPRTNSVAEAQSRFEASNPHVSVSEQENSKDLERSEGQGDDEAAANKMFRVCDRLIELFMIEKTSSGDWRKLLAFSEEWTKIRPHFFERCSANAKAEEDPKRRGDILKLARQLKEVDEDMCRHNDLLREIEENDSEVDAIISKRRKDFTGDFFEHLHNLCDANYKNLDRRDEIATIARKCLSAIEAHDVAQADDKSLDEAQLKFDDIMNSPSLEAAANKIDKLAQRQELDSTLMLLITKAWAAAKESTMMKEEVKDIMFHLYNVARGNMQRLVPKEVRIIRYLLSIQDPCEQLAAMKDAFSPGDELEGKDEDLLYTTPDKLHKWIKIVLDAYRTNKQSTLIKEAQKLMKPEVISRIESLKYIVEDQFL